VAVVITRKIHDPYGFIEVPANVDIRSYLFVLPVSFRGCCVEFGGCLPI
jgi:hypothetical protein